jgi:hypothetical protein
VRVKIVLLLISAIAVFTLSACTDPIPPSDPALSADPNPPGDPNPPATYGILRIVDEDVFTEGSWSYIGATIDGVEQNNGGSVADSFGNYTDFTLSTGDHQVYLWKVIMHPGGYWTPFELDWTITIRKDQIHVWSIW